MKNVGKDLRSGKVGKIYVPKQEVFSIALLSSMFLTLFCEQGPLLLFILYCSTFKYVTGIHHVS